MIEAKPNRVFASANPGSGGFAWIAMIKRDQANAASRVASDAIIRAAPAFARSPDGQFLYVGEVSFSPNSLYKLDLSTDAAPIVLEDDHGSVSGTDYMALSPDSSRIYLRSGQVLQTADFVQIGLVGSGIPRVNSTGSRVFVARAPGLVEVYETTFFTKVDEVALPCSISSLKGFELLDDGDGVLLLGDSKVCGVGGNAFQTSTCRLTPSYAGGVLTLAFEVGTPSPAVWNFWVSAGNTTTKLWQVSLPVVDPVVPVNVPIPNFPQVGTIGFLTTLVGPSGITCSDFDLVDTGGAGTPLSAPALKNLFSQGEGR